MALVAHPHTCQANLSEEEQAPDIAHASTCFKFVEIDEDTVTKHLNHLNDKKAMGADGISAKPLRLAAPGIAKSVTMLFNYSLKKRQIPKDWKAAHVAPVPKKGDRDLTENYRPVSVLPILAKVFEAKVHTQLYEYLKRTPSYILLSLDFAPSITITISRFESRLTT